MTTQTTSQISDVEQTMRINFYTRRFDNPIDIPTGSDDFTIINKDFQMLVRDCARTAVEEQLKNESQRYDPEEREDIRELHQSYVEETIWHRTMINIPTLNARHFIAQGVQNFYRSSYTLGTKMTGGDVRMQMLSAADPIIQRIADDAAANAWMRAGSACENCWG